MGVSSDVVAGFDEQEQQHERGQSEYNCGGYPVRQVHVDSSWLRFCTSFHCIRRARGCENRELARNSAVRADGRKRSCPENHAICTMRIANCTRGTRVCMAILTEPRRLLIIDDETSLRRTLRTALESMGHTVAEAANGTQALHALGAQRFYAAFLDLRLGKENGLELLPQLLRAALGLHIIIVTAHASFDSAIQALRLGAFDYPEAVHARSTAGRTRPLHAIARIDQPRGRSRRSGRPTDADRGTRNVRAGHAARTRSRVSSRTDRCPRAVSRRERNGERRRGAAQQRVDEVCPVRCSPAGAEVVAGHGIKYIGTGLRPIVTRRDVMKGGGVTGAFGEGVDRGIDETNRWVAPRRTPAR